MESSPDHLRIRALALTDASACDQIIASLPYHFGNDDGRSAASDAVRSQAGLIAERGGRVAGFLTVKPFRETSCEITWMAVHADQRGQGIGRLLIAGLREDALAEGRQLILVTTLSDSVDEEGVDDGYERTRSFYRRQGFVPAWEPEGMWPGQQALLMVMPLPLPT